MPDDVRLMGALAAGDGDALAEIAARLVPPLRSLAVRIVGVAAGDDVVQETLERVWRNASRFDAERGSLEGWALRIGRNVAIGHLRRERAGRNVSGSGAVVDLDRIADHGAGPAEVAERSALADTVRLAVGRLRPERRAALECVLAGYTLVGAAHALGVPEGTLKSRVRAAHADLRPDPQLVALVS